MTERWQQIDAWFARALEAEPTRREQVLDSCDDPGVREQVRLLLASANEADGFLNPGGALEGPLGTAVMQDLALTGGGKEASGPADTVFEPGELLAGRYRIVDCLGEGGMGVVYRALDEKLQREVAVKLVCESRLEDDWRGRLLREARAAAALNHPGLVAVYDVAEQAEHPFLVMELVDGPSLAEQPPQSIEEIVRVARQLCDALEHAHDHGIVHRDLKPANVLCTHTDAGPRAKITDLGIALWTRGPRTTHTGRVFGTPTYMSPEQARGAAIDGRADLYALGVMLYEWTTGRPPFSADDPMVLVSQHVHAPVTAPRLLRAELPDDLNLLILRLLAKSPDDRYASAAELARALDSLGQASPATPTNERGIDSAGGALDRARDAYRNHRWTDAYQAYRQAAESSALGADDLARLARTARWAGHYNELLPLLESAAAEYKKQGDDRGCAQMALELALTHLDRRENTIFASWLRRAETLLEGKDESAEHAYLAWLQNRGLWLTGAWREAFARAEQALAISRRVGSHELEAMSLLDLGHIRLAEHRYDEAAPFLDEAGSLVMSGELRPFASGFVICGLIFAWRTRGNWNSAAEWTDTSIRWCERENVSYFPGLCRIHRGELIRLRGLLAQAEEDLERGTAEMLRADSWIAGVGYRELGDVRLRRGNLEGAEEAFRKAIELGTDPQPALALLRLEQGDTGEALRQIREALNEDGFAHFLDRENRVYVLPAAVTIAIAAGELELARDCVEELERIAEARDANAHRASAAGARGQLLLAEGDADGAVRKLQESWRRWCQIDAPFESAEVKTRIAAGLRRRGDLRDARLHAEAALSIFERLGADLGARRAREQLEACC